MKALEKIVFFGSGPVAAQSLEQIKDTFDIEAIVTKPATVAQMRKVINTTVLACSNRSELDDVIGSQVFTARVAVLVDFGIIVSQKVISAFELGIINSHFSLLPEWRGADPISHSILSGQKFTGVSLMLINPGLDEGDLLAQKRLNIIIGETTPSLTRKLVHLSSEMLKQYLPQYLQAKITPFPQDLTEKITYASKICKADGEIDWSKPAEIIEREVRAYQGWPKSYTKLKDVNVTIIKAHVVPSSTSKKPGTLQIDGKDSLVIYCGKNCLGVDELQPAGKRPMDARAFLAGYKSRLG